MLTLEIELLTGVYRASLPDGSGPEWPPHPERVFSALVQAWGDGGRDAAERSALEWLERQSAPLIDADADASHRTAPVVFVPPNDADGGRLEALPDRRRRQARTFAAVVPERPKIHFHWSECPNEPHRRAFDRLAARVASLGHSSSLVRFAFGTRAEPPAAAWTPDEGGTRLLRAPYPQRLADLERWFGADDASRPTERPRTLRFDRYRSPADVAPPASIPCSHFGGERDWFVFEDVNGDPPDLLAFPVIARRLRDALMSLGPQPAPEVLSGHAQGGGPSARVHAAVVPLASVGVPYASGALLGFAVVLPRDLAEPDRSAALAALAGFVRYENDRACGELKLGSFGIWVTERAPAPSRSSLRPDRWCRAARAWASATPVFLDRFPDGGDPAESASVVAAACRNIGLPEPVEVEIHKHSAVAGAPSAYPARGRKSLIDWSIPTDASYRSRARRHVVLRFAQPVQGPVILGAGRYQGLGLCLPFDERERP